MPLTYKYPDAMMNSTTHGVPQNLLAQTGLAVLIFLSFQTMGCRTFGKEHVENKARQVSHLSITHHHLFRHTKLSLITALTISHLDASSIATGTAPIVNGIASLTRRPSTTSHCKSASPITHTNTSSAMTTPKTLIHFTNF